MVADTIQANASLRRYALKVSLVYAAVVTTGLLGSIRLLFWEAADEGALARLLALAGVGFVALTGLLLYLALVRAPPSPPQAYAHTVLSVIPPETDRRLHWVIAATVVVLVGAILGNVAYTQFVHRKDIVAHTASTAEQPRACHRGTCARRHRRGRRDAELGGARDGDPARARHAARPGDSGAAARLPAPICRMCARSGSWTPKAS